jgi:uncharacterized protein YecT (DUF1311 family)
MRFVTGAFLMVLLGAATAPRVVAETPEDCGPDGTTSERAACFNRIYERTDAALDALYRRLSDALADPGERALLQEAERAWSQYRDKQCDFETAGTRAGTIHPIVVLDCLAEKTKAHTEELQRQLNCPDGDTGCLHDLRQ